MSQALLEDSFLDPIYGRFASGNFAEFHAPVNADIGTARRNLRRGGRFEVKSARGIREIGITSLGATLANATYHATGIRIRELPIILDKPAGRHLPWSLNAPFR